MTIALAILETLLCIGFVVFGWQRWQMEYNASAMLCFVLATYFGRIALNFVGQAWPRLAIAGVVDVQTIFTNAALLLFSLALAIAEAHQQGFQAWYERWKERHR